MHLRFVSDAIPIKQQKVFRGCRIHSSHIPCVLVGDLKMVNQNVWLVGTRDILQAEGSIPSEMDCGGVYVNYFQVCRSR